MPSGLRDSSVMDRHRGQAGERTVAFGLSGQPNKHKTANLNTNSNSKMTNLVKWRKSPSIGGINVRVVLDEQCGNIQMAARQIHKLAQILIDTNCIAKKPTSTKPHCEVV